MVKHTLSWSLMAIASLGAVYGMSNAATLAEVALLDSSDIAKVTAPPPKAQRTKSGLEYFRFREGNLEWKIQHIYSDQDMVQNKKFNLKCYGRTQYYDASRMKNIEEINEYFSGLVPMTPEDEDGYASGSSRIQLRTEEMRYTLKCGLFEKMILVNPRDWPSNTVTLELKNFNKKKRSGVEKKQQTEEFITVRAAGTKKAVNVVPGTKKAVIASFTFDAKKKMRINSIIFSSPKWFVSPGVLKHISITIDDKSPDSFNLISNKKSLHVTGLGDYGLFDTIMPGKHLIELRASIMNPPTKKVYSDSFTVSSIQGIAGSGLKLKLKNPVRLQTYMVSYDKKRTKKDDENLEQ